MADVVSSLNNAIFTKLIRENRSSMYSLPSIPSVCLPTTVYSRHLIFHMVMEAFQGWVQDFSRARGLGGGGGGVAGSLGLQNQWGMFAKC